MKILKSSAAIRRAIVELMAPGKRRVAITAFVGDGARAFLPKPKGIELICWPKAGGTNPLELRRLKKAGVRIRFVDGLHMKLYWASHRGAIVTSANLSTNALGAGNLKELGILLPTNAIDIDELIASLKSRRFNKTDIHKLEVAHRKLQPWQRGGGQHVEKVTYTEWFSLPSRCEWKLGWWDEHSDFAQEAKEIVRNDFNKRTPEDFIACQKNDYNQTDWVLTFRVTRKGAVSPKWIFVDFVVKVSRKDKKAYYADFPCQAIQVWTTRHYPPPPFVITREFRAALCKASVAFGVERMQAMRSTRPQARLLKMIAKRMRS